MFGENVGLSGILEVYASGTALCPGGVVVAVDADEGRWFDLLSAAWAACWDAEEYPREPSIDDRDRSGGGSEA
jgi:hypothetical protein